MNDETQGHDFYISVGDSKWSELGPVEDLKENESQYDEIINAQLFTEPFEIDIPLTAKSGRILNNLAKKYKQEG